MGMTESSGRQQGLEPRILLTDTVQARNVHETHDLLQNEAKLKQGVPCNKQMAEVTIPRRLHVMPQAIVFLLRASICQRNR
ncbi:hypothetical protein DVH05_003156 [Phytophthora capsici]|nr:hypothetical protein DVH05_003156 [Phytophthora capsici]